MFSKKDLKQIKKHGLTLENINEQLSILKNGFPELTLCKPATVEEGILRLDQNQINSFIENYTKNIINISCIKFVPASGAATRMFKALNDFIDKYKETEEDYLNYLTDKKPESVKGFFENIKAFAFYNDLHAIVKEKDVDIEKLIKSNNFNQLLNSLLNEEGLCYNYKPKGLIKFHKYGKDSKTAFEEHLIESAHYCKSKSGYTNLHYTISEEHEKEFKKCLKENRKNIEKKFNTKFKVSFSYQKKSTDTIAVDTKNNPFKNEKNNLIFRPGGHGALIENLNDLKSEMVFVKNIDNVVPERLVNSISDYKKLLGGILLDVKEQIFEYLKKLNNAKEENNVLVDEIFLFLEETLTLKIPSKIKNLTYKNKVKFALNKLNRPIRVCGMVLNEGEPGGGPFIVKDKDGCCSLQIVEKSQVNIENKKQLNILKNSTHFNPVDIVCWIKDYQNKKFNLLEFVDKESGIITEKSFLGKDLKALELPGLWNGAMANWNSIFVEVPLSTFSPVKTVMDLLRIEHRN